MLSLKLLGIIYLFMSFLRWCFQMNIRKPEGKRIFLLQHTVFDCYTIYLQLYLLQGEEVITQQAFVSLFFWQNNLKRYETSLITKQHTELKPCITCSTICIDVCIRVPICLMPLWSHCCSRFSTLQCESAVLTHLLQYLQGNGNAAGNSVKINYTALLEIRIIPEHIITKQSGPVCILCWCTDLGAAQCLC